MDGKCEVTAFSEEARKPWSLFTRKGFLGVA
jgi:hypothetical protein